VTYYEDDEAYILEENNADELNAQTKYEDIKDDDEQGHNHEEDEMKDINNLSDYAAEKPNMNNQGNDEDEINENPEENQEYDDPNNAINHQDNLYIHTQSSNHQNETNNNNNLSSNLISLNYISICQGCRVNFNSHENLPLSFKCGHFFCKNCIIMNYTDPNYNVCCPVDGTCEKSIKDLKLLKNLILDISDESIDVRQSSNEKSTNKNSQQKNLESKVARDIPKQSKGNSPLKVMISIILVLL
jgi:hypothetical protein